MPSYAQGETLVADWGYINTENFVSFFSFSLFLFETIIKTAVQKTILENNTRFLPREYQRVTVRKFSFPHLFLENN